VRTAACSIGLRMRGLLRANHSRCAGDILHIDSLPKVERRRGQNTGHEINGVSGAGRHDQPDRARGPALRMSLAREAQNNAQSTRAECVS